MRKTRYLPGPKAIGGKIGKFTRSALKKRGFAAADILLHWDQIVGSHLAQYSCPEKLNYSRQNNLNASLKLRVAPGHAPEITHLEPQIIEKINAFFGYRAVGRLQLIQAPIMREKPKHKKQFQPLSKQTSQELEGKLQQVEDPDLQARLRSLGQKILAEKK